MNPDDVIIRPESAGNANERSAIRLVNEGAFGGSEEADLVDKLVDAGDDLLSLVAEVNRRIIGHALFSRLRIETQNGNIPAVALAPVAVLPDYRNRGIGGQLIRHGIDVLRGRGEAIVIVIGHPAYYPRFGFSSEKAQSLESPFPVEAEAFMALELSPGALDRVRGKLRYPVAFGL